MCMGCVTSAEAMIITGTGAVGAAKVGAGRLLDRVSGRAAGERKRRTYEHTAAFLTELGHDPETILGAAPAVQPPSAGCVSDASPIGHDPLTQPTGTRLAPA